VRLDQTGQESRLKETGIDCCLGEIRHGWARLGENWVQLGKETGRGDWARRLGKETGQGDWARRLGEETGRGDWARRLGEETRRGDWARRLGDWARRLPRLIMTRRGWARLGKTGCNWAILGEETG
jgi:hypothetical protein